MDSTFQTTVEVATSKPGFVDIERVLNHDSGECRVVSFWETERAALAAFADETYYGGTKAKLRHLVRFDQLKTEHYDLLPFLAGRGLVTSSFARCTTLSLADSSTSGEVDAFYGDIVNRVISKKTGFQVRVYTQ